MRPHILRASSNRWYAVLVLRRRRGGQRRVADQCTALAPPAAPRHALPACLRAAYPARPSARPSAPRSRQHQQVGQGEGRQPKHGVGLDVRNVWDHAHLHAGQGGGGGARPAGREGEHGGAGELALVEQPPRRRYNRIRPTAPGVAAQRASAAV